MAGVRGEGEVRWAWGRVIGGDMEGSYGFFLKKISLFLILLCVVGFGLN